MFIKSTKIIKQKKGFGGVKKIDIFLKQDSWRYSINYTLKARRNSMRI
ncbi:hypothetical protein ACJZL3_04565 [Wolbachia endosymbiont of Rhagoletis cingulata]